MKTTHTHFATVSELEDTGVIDIYVMAGDTKQIHGMHISC